MSAPIPTCAGGCEGPRMRVHRAPCRHGRGAGSTHGSGTGGGHWDTRRAWACACQSCCSARGPPGTWARRAPAWLSGLPGSGCCDSGPQWLSPNWFEGRGEPAQLAGVGDAVRSQARPHCLSGTPVGRGHPQDSPTPPPGSQWPTPPRLCPLYQGFWPGPRPVSPEAARTRA